MSVSVFHAVSGNIFGGAVVEELKAHGMKPIVILGIGGILVYLSLTGKADKLFKSVFGK